MKKIMVICGFFFIGFISCEKNETNSKDADLLTLENQLDEIKTLARSIVCDDAKNWDYTPYGEKACGGPVGFIGYSKNMDTVVFLALIADYRQAQMKFNKKWNIISDCLMVQPPVRIACENGEAILIYE